MKPGVSRGLSIAEFLSEVAAFGWARRVWRVDMHHTLDPDHARWREIGSRAVVDAMRRSHIRDRGCEDIAQHVSIMPDGEIWTGRDWNRTPASVGIAMSRGVFMLEVVGNFDKGRDRLEGAQLEATIAVIRGVQARFRLPAEALLFHRDVPQSDKTCPGSGVEKAEIVRLLRRSPVCVAPFGACLARLPLEAEAKATGATIRSTG